MLGEEEEEDVREVEEVETSLLGLEDGADVLHLRQAEEKTGKVQDEDAEGHRALSRDESLLLTPGRRMVSSREKGKGRAL